MADKRSTIAPGRDLGSRIDATIRRAELLASASRELIQQSQREQDAAATLLDSLLELRGFIRESRTDFDHALQRKRRRRT